MHSLHCHIMFAGGELLKTIEGCDSIGSFILTDVLPSAAMMQIGYGTSIVSFLGAVHWYAFSEFCALRAARTTFHLVE